MLLKADYHSSIHKSIKNSC